MKTFEQFINEQNSYDPVNEGRLQDFIRRIKYGKNVSVVDSGDNSWDIISDFAKKKGMEVSEAGQDKRYIYFVITDKNGRNETPFEYDKKTKKFIEFKFTYKHLRNSYDPVNEGKYDGTWYKDIADAKMSDKDDGTFKSRRSLVAHIQSISLSDVDKMSDKDVQKYLNDLTKKIVSEVKNKTLSKKINNELERILDNGQLSIHAHASVPDRLKIQFVEPCLFNNDYSSQSFKSVFDFLKDSESLTCESQPTIKNKFDVEYNGTCQNDKGEIIEFSEVNNGLAVNIG